MERAAKAVRRGGVRLLSLGGGHGELNMVISEQKDVKNAAKTFMAAQNSAAQYVMKWATQEENRAIQDVSSQIQELNMVWTEAQREFAEHLKDFRQMFEMVLEGEKHIDQAKNNLAMCEQREAKIKKELKRAAKKATTEELLALENRLAHAERQKDLAQLEVEDRIRENEAVKLIRFKEGLLKLSSAYVELGRKCTIIFESQRDISHQLPDIHEKDLEDIKYTGSGATKHYVLQAKEKVRQYKRRPMHETTLPLTNLSEPPPPYTPGDFYQKEKEAGLELVEDEPMEQPPYQLGPRNNVTTTRRTLANHPLQQRQRSVETTDDLHWGSEDEDDELSGAMGGMKL